MANERKYSIVINGVEKSIADVNKLVAQLDELEKRMQALQGKNVSVGTGGGGKSSLSADDKLYKQILATEQKIEQTNEEDYKILLKKKAELKEIQKIQKSTFAEEQQQTKEYANTLNGQRQRLTDMKAALANMTIGSDGFNKQVKEIDALNEKIKEIEASFGQHSRNVGNYADSVAEGMSKITMTVNGTERTFNNAKQASRELGNELKTMAINGQQGTKEYEELDRIFKRLESTMKDVSRSSAGMDKLLDTMQGFAAIGSVGRGLSSLFGFDNNALGESIQKMMALQSIMQGIEVIQKQMTTNEGLGGMFNVLSDEIDDFSQGVAEAATSLVGFDAQSKATAKTAQVLGTALKALTGVMLGLALNAAMKQFEDLGKRVGNIWSEITGGGYLSEEQRMQLALEETNRILEGRIQLIQTDPTYSKYIKDYAILTATTEAVKLQVESLREEVVEINNLSDAMDMLKKAGNNLWDNVTSGKGVVGSFLDSGDWVAKQIMHYKSAKKSNEDLEKSIKSIAGTSKAATNQISEDAKELVTRWASQMDKMGDNAEENRKIIEQMAKQLSDDKILQSVVFNMGRYVNDKEFIAKMNNILKSYWDMRNGISGGLPNISITQALTDKTKSALSGYKQTYEKLKREIEEKNNKGGKSIGAAASKTVDDIEAVILRHMQEGLQKTLRQIDYDTNKEIAQLKLSGQKKQDAVLAIEAERQRKVEEAYRQHAERMRKMQEELEDLQSNNTILSAKNAADSASLQRDTWNAGRTSFFDPSKNWGDIKAFMLDLDHVETGVARIKALLFDKDTQLISIFENVMKGITELNEEFEKGKMSEEEYSDRYQDILKEADERKIKLNLFDEDKAKETIAKIDDLFKQYYAAAKNNITNDKSLEMSLKKKIEGVLNEVGYSLDSTIFDPQYDSLKKAFADGLRVRQDFYKAEYDMEVKTNAKILAARKAEIEEENKLEQQRLSKDINAKIGGANNPLSNITEGFTIPVSSMTEQELKSAEEVWWKHVDIIKNAIKAVENDATKTMQEKSKEINDLLQGLGGSLGDALAAGDIEFKDFLQQYTDYYNEYVNKIQLLNEQTLLKQQKLEQDTQKANADALAKRLKSEADYLEKQVSAVGNRLSTLPVLNKFGIVNIGATKKNLQELEDVYTDKMNNLTRLLLGVRAAWDSGLISPEAFAAISEQLNTVITNTQEKLNEVKGKKGNIFGDWWKSIAPYAQEFVNGMSGVLSELSNLYSAQYDALMENLNKQTEALEEKYSEQEEIEQRHKDNMQAIQDEITNARGARREQLVDMYNAEIAAQRRAFAEKKKIEREEKQLEAKKKAEEKNERKRQNKINLAQMAMSQAMAIMNAYATSPWYVGLAMGILATTLTAVQMGLAIKAQKESEKYAEGGIIQGKSHAQGGVKVLGGQAEVEGGEFITNKRTTAKNADLLTFINSKNKRITPTDLNDFFTGKTNNRIKNNLKNKFATGGQLPATTVKKASNTIVVVDKSTPIVQVVDIVDATKRYNNVRVLAGIED